MIIGHFLSPLSTMHTFNVFLKCKFPSSTTTERLHTSLIASQLRCVARDMALTAMMNN